MATQRQPKLRAGIFLCLHLAAGTLVIAPAFAAPDDAPPDAVSDPLPLRNVSASKPKAASAKPAKRKLPAADAPLAVRTVRTLRVDATPLATVPPLAEPSANPASVVKPTPPSPTATPSLDADVQAFCGHVGKAATDARVAWQTARLTELETTLKARVTELEAKIAEHRQWLAQREDAARRAGDFVVAIYARMRPDAAALQIAALDDASAAALLLKLNPRVASAILGEIPAERAARLTDAISGGRAKSPDEKTNS